MRWSANAVACLIFRRRFSPATLFGRLPCRGIAAGMRDHGQRLAMIDGKGRHVVVLKLLMLIIAENDHDIRIDLLQGISQRLNRFLTGLIALPELFRREFAVEIGFRSLH